VDSPKSVVNNINSSIPESLKESISFDLDENNYLSLNVKNTQLKFQSTYLTDLLGLNKEQRYPKNFPTSPIFIIKTDITVPGYEVLVIDVFVSYSKILRSFISSINISLRDIYSQNYIINSTFVIKFHLRRSSVV